MGVHVSEIVVSSTFSLLELSRTRDEIAQEKIYTQRHMNNAWSEMVILTPCLSLKANNTRLFFSHYGPTL